MARRRHWVFGLSRPSADRLSNELRSQAYRFPPVDVTEREDGYRVQAALPGFKPEEVEVTVSAGVLTIQAKHSEERSSDEDGYLRREIALGNVFRSLRLPGGVKADAVTASYENGVLTVDVPRGDRPVKVRIAGAGLASRRST